MVQPPNTGNLINGEKVDRVTDFEYLGVTLDQNLNLKKHFF